MKKILFIIIMTTLGVIGISFATDNINATTESRFRWMIYTCDGWSEIKVWNETSCKPISLWKEYATNWCPAGTTLSSFSTIDDCSSAVRVPAVNMPSAIVPPATETSTTTIQPIKDTQPIYPETQVKRQQPAYIDINLPVADKILETFIQKHPDIKQEVSCVWLKYYVDKIAQQTKTVLGIPNVEREAEIRSHFKELLYNYLNDVLECDTTLPTKTEKSIMIEKPNITKTENYFRWITYACDSWPETKLWKETSCKPYSVWKDFAVSQCSTADKLSTFITIDVCGSTIDSSTATIPAETEKQKIIEKPTNIEKPTSTTTKTENYFKWITYTCGDWSENEKLDENVCQLYSLLKESAMNYCWEKGGLSKFNTIEPCAPTTEEKTESTKLETEMAYEYAMKNGITTQPTIKAANVQGKLTRVDMSKMIVKFAEKVLDKAPDTSKECVFNDIADQPEKMQNFIIESCQLWLMWQWINNFYPNNTVTRAEFATTLSRALYGDTYDWGDVYYEEHLKALKSDDIISNTTTPLAPEIRGYVWMMLQRADDKVGWTTAEEINK